MSFIGESQNPAPKLKEAKLADAEYELAYDQCVQVRLTYNFTLILMFVEVCNSDVSFNSYEDSKIIVYSTSNKHDSSLSDTSEASLIYPCCWL